MPSCILTGCFFDGVCRKESFFFIAIDVQVSLHRLGAGCRVTRWCIRSWRRTFHAEGNARFERPQAKLQELKNSKPQVQLTKLNDSFISYVEGYHAHKGPQTRGYVLLP
jgi:hypothetical protein